MLHYCHSYYIFRNSSTENQIIHPAISIRKNAVESMEQQAQNMLERTREKLQEVKVGECVAVFVSEFGRGKGGPTNVIGVDK